MRISRGVIDELAAGGIDTVFGIPGKQTLPLNEAIADRDETRFLVARHETAVSHEAWGYAETSGDPAATVVVPGPGDMNALNGLKNAANDCTPLVHIAVETEPDVRGGDGIHETPPETYDPLVKENILVERPAATRVVVRRAIETATTPPKGPVRIGIPKNFLVQDRPLATVPSGHPQPDTPELPDEDIRAAASCLEGAERPVILVGGGARAAGASEELLAVADALDAPVVTTYKGKGVVSDSNERIAGTLSGSASPELLDCLANSDALLAVGTDFDGVATRHWSVEMPAEIVQVTLSPGDLGTGYDLTVGIVADAADALAALDAELSATAGTGGVERATVVRNATEERIDPLLDDDPPITSVRALRAVRAALPEETVVSVDAGGFRVWALNTFDACGPRSYVNPGSWATMGTGLSAAIGAQVANPDKNVVALSGDGGLMMCIHELHTAASEDIPVTVVVFNNSDYAIISEEADRTFGLGEGAYGWADAPLAFTTIAAGMGVEAARAETPGEIKTELTRALDSDEPRLVEIPTDPDEPQASEWMTPQEDSN